MLESLVLSIAFYAIVVLVILEAIHIGRLRLSKRA